MKKKDMKPTPRATKCQRILSQLARGQLFGQGFRIDAGGGH